LGTVVGKRCAAVEAAIKVKVVWSDIALDDLDAIRAYYFELTGDMQVGARIGGAILESAAALASFPGRGHLGVDGSREWIVNRYPQYLLIYDVDEKRAEVFILGVHHQSRGNRASTHSL
jgi:plasmid stabilization system protein ParE